MANTPRWYDSSAEAALTTIATSLNSGFIDIYTGTQPSQGASLTGTRASRLTFGATAFGTATASGGTVTATANAITSDTSATGGTAGYYALVESDGTTVVATGSVGTSGADLNLSSTTIGAGSTVSCSAYALTMPET